MEGHHESPYVYHLDDSDVIAFVNQDWLDFATANGKPDLTETDVVGKSLWEFIHGPETRTFYENLFRTVRVHNQERRVFFRCDAPHIKRRMVLLVCPLPNHSLQLEGHVLGEEPITLESYQELWLSVAQQIIQQCSLCLRVKNRANMWMDWIAMAWQLALLRHILPVQYLICPDCDHHAATQPI